MADDVLDWDLCRRQFETARRSPAGRAAGCWALGVLEETLGDSWLATVWQKEPQATRFIVLAPFHQVAFAHLLELALRIWVLKDTPGMAKVRAPLRTDPLHALVDVVPQLEIAALGKRLGFDVALEVKRRSSPIDVCIGTPTADLSVETRVLHTSMAWRDADARQQRVSNAVRDFSMKHSVWIAGEQRVDVEGDEADDLLRELDSVAHEVAATGVSRSVNNAVGSFRVVPGHLAGPGDAYRGPLVEGRGTTRIDSVLREKAAQANSSGATWLFLAAHDGLWQFTNWSTESLGNKARALSHHSGSIIEGAGLHGVILTSGSLQAQGHFEDESYRGPGGIIGHRRVLPLGRVRETVVVPFEPASSSEVEAVREILDDEPAWLDWALLEAGLSTIDAVAQFCDT